MRIARLETNYSIQLKYTLFPLHPYVPDEGMTLEALFKGRGIDIEAAQERIRALAEQEGLELKPRTMTYNSRPAQELGKWADLRHGNKEIHHHLYRAYFVHNINLASIDDLVSIAGSLGLDQSEARSVLENKTFSPQVDADWQRCRELSVMAVPTYFCGSERLVGAQSYQALEECVISQGATMRNA